MSVAMAPDLAKVEELFEAARSRPPDERARYLDEACGRDTELRVAVESLLTAHSAAGRFLNTPTVTLPPPGSPASGTMIGRYKLLETIGEGGYGTVFMAEQTEPVHRKVALKIIKAGMDTRQVIARFEAERQALALMDHPNIAKVFDAGVTEAGTPYFVMELVKGVPITKYCDEHHLMPRDRLELFMQVCQAVQHAHQKGIIHRDLKPTNVLVALYDGKPVPKVIDFGVAKATGRQLTERTMFTGFGDVIGTPQYMSPEQAELNQLDIDTRSDIYSLGVLLYELLTGTTPIEYKRVKEVALLEVLRVIREEEPPRPSTRLSTVAELPSIAAQRGLEPKKLSGLVHGELDWIVMKALEKDRNRRYETANGFARDVERYLHDEAVLACPPTAWYRLRKLARRHGKAFSVVAAFVLLLLAATVVSSWQAVRATRAKAEALAQTKRADQQASIAEGVNQFFTDEVFGLADPKRFDRAGIKLVEALDIAANKIDSRFPNDPALRGYIRDRIGEIYIGIDRPQKAVEQLQEAYELRSGTAGARDPMTIRTRTNLGWALYLSGRYSEARDVLYAALADQTQVRGPGHPETARTAGHLASVLRDLRQAGWGPELDDRSSADLDVPRNAYEQALAALGPRHLATLNSQNSLAWSLRWRNRNAEALEHARAAMIGLRETRGRDDLETSYAIYNYACCLMNLGRPEEAVAEFEALRASRSRILGPGHTDTVYAAWQLANALRSTGKPEKSLEVLESVRAHLQDIEAGTPWRRVDLLLILAGSYESLGRYDRAAEFCAAAYRAIGDIPEEQVARRTLAAWLNGLAGKLANLPAPEFRDAPRAIELAKRSVVLRPSVGPFWATLGSARYRAGDFAQAKADLEHSIQLQPHGDGLALFVLSMSQWQLGDADGARKSYDQGIAWMDKTNPNNEVLLRFRREAEELMKIAGTQPTTKAESK
jgi:tetratricopeptide (TPR) repeat protein